VSKPSQEHIHALLLIGWFAHAVEHSHGADSAADSE
jgi:hypothetical protein